MILATAWGWSATTSIVLSIALAFAFGYGLSIFPVLKHGVAIKKAITIVLAADTVSIAVMELADNGFILLVPGAINAELSAPLFWISLSVSLIVAFFAALPVNRYLIARGKGHAVMGEIHHHH